MDVAPGVAARVLAGKAWNQTGPFATVQDVQMIDFELKAGSSGCIEISPTLDTAMLYVYEGKLEKVNSHQNPVGEGHIVLFDASTDEQRGIELTTTGNYTYNFMTNDGCDSTVLVDLEVAEASFVDFFIIRTIIIVRDVYINQERPLQKVRIY